MTNQHREGVRGAGTLSSTRPLRQLLQYLRAFDRRRPWVWDLAVTLFWVGAALTDYASSGWRMIAQNLDVPDWQLLVISLGFTVPLYWRRRHPMGVLLATAPFALANGWTGAILQAHFVQLAAVFNLAVHRPLKQLAPAAVVVLVPLIPGALRYPLAAWDGSFGPAVWGFILSALLGIAVRSRMEHLASLVDRAHRLEIERDQQAQLAAAAERTRIAREMHDIIGHNLSVITGLADGGAYAAKKNPERAVQALEAIGTTSRGALAELRRLLDVLREDSPAADLAPAPALSDLDSLVEGVRAAGLPVRVSVQGSPADLPPGLELSVYRVIQEALTNTLKHGGPSATAEVVLSYGTDEVTATVTDTGKGGTPSDGGRGLAGMKERTSLYQGTLEAGPQPAGGWRVHLRIPVPPLEGPA
ncbi:sensor histidine kinase [Streptomyces sp. TRM66268-LWL]|uniref:histidine kinase n=1 Tax=Streptomyces polyasparticus TaxID=2767826 RepID=A0ABR7SXY1_9ACTN|nr:sensor histidine kinase [Streptomyces polyasparticus]MBC9719123.1 sensor histidine kinase [Streptomyces polyasparticus]